MSSATICARVLQRQLGALGVDAANFALEFQNWKSMGAAGEYDSYLFGKDGAYGSRVSAALRHVHLVPIADVAALAVWNRQWTRRGRKVSDRALVYAAAQSYGNLLIFIFNEPDAHRVARMQSSADAELMLKLSKIAE
jgi:mRNA interferase YafO